LDGRFILTSKYPDAVIHVRDTRTLEDVNPLKNDLPVRWFRLTPDGKFLLAGQQYAEHRSLITKWELESSRRVWSHAGPADAMGEFSDSGRYYLTKSGWNLWALWDTEAGTICCIVVHEDNVRPSCFKFNEDEMSLYLTGEKDQLLWSGDLGG
jgi:WD40 repeat protein